MSETSALLIQSGILGVLLAFMALSIRYLARRLEKTEDALHHLENAMLRERGLPGVHNGDEELPFN